MKTYLEIINAWGPSQAVAGSSIYVQVRLRTKGASVHAKLSAEYDSDIVWTPEAALNPNTDYSWTLSLTMPNKSITVYIKAYYLQLGEWVLDDSFGPFSIYLPGEMPPLDEELDIWGPIMTLVVLVMLVGMMVPMMRGATKELEAGYE